MSIGKRLFCDRRLLLVQMFFLISLFTYSQNKNLKGMVIDELGDPVIGANIMQKGTTNGTTTNFDGEFELSLPENCILNISFIGYIPQSVNYTGQSTLRIILKEDAKNLDEVVVVGYGVMRKSDLTGSVAKIDVNEIKKVSTVDAAQAMQGRLAGVNVISNSGNPGAGTTIRVRGVGTINNSDPLYVVDGFPSSDISHIAPTDIESMEVLKDASATAIYGARGANGVILVKTKSGTRDNKVELQANVYMGVSQMINQLDLADATQFAIAKTKTGYSDDKLQYIINQSNNGNYLRGTNWQDEVTRQSFTQRYNVSVQGSGNGYSYNHGVTYSDEQGIIKGTEMQKFMFISNNQYSITKKVKLGLNMNYVTYKKPGFDSGSFYDSTLPGVFRADPISAAIDSYTDFYGQMYYATANDNPALSIWKNKYSNQTEDRFIGNFFLQIDDLLVKGLSFRAQYGKILTFNEQKNYSPEYYITPSQKNDLSSLYQLRNQGDTWSNTNYFSYNRTVSKLNIGATLGMELLSNTWSNLGMTAYGVPADSDLRYMDASTNTELFSKEGAQITNRLASGFFRANLSWNNKYLLTGTVRADGSSRFYEEQRWGYFPSFSAGWNVANESFMEPIEEILPIFKVRAGWGLVGNQDSADDFGYLSSVNKGYYYAFNKKPVDGAVQEQLSNKELTWESAEQMNIGIDYGFFDNRLNGSLDYFIRKTKDMIIDQPVPLYAGKKRPKVNAGTMENKGVEVSLNWNDKIGDFSYGLGVNATWIKNEITSLSNGEPIRDGAIGRVGYTTKTEVGREIAYFYGYQTAGIFKSQADIDNYVTKDGTPIQGPGGTPQLGDVIFLDRNNDGQITEDDMTYIGSGTPTVTGGINLNLGYKNLDFTMFMTYSYGNEIVNSMYQSLYSTDMFESNISRDMALNHWSAENPDSNLPRLGATDSNKNALLFSDRMVEDGSYLRIKQIQLGYTLPERISQKACIKSLRVFASVDNLYTFTKYTGLDPEIYSFNSNPLCYGIDMVNYPQPRTFSFGLNVTF